MTSGSQKRLFSAELKMKKNMLANSGGAPSGIDTSGVTNADILTAIKALQSEMMMRAVQAKEEAKANSDEISSHLTHSSSSNSVDEINLLHNEVRALSRSILETKREIKALGGNEEDQFNLVTSELDEIVGATERATETIMDSAEKIDDLAQQLRQHSPDQFVTQLTDEILEQTIAMFEACNFQDLCGQRTTKVVNALAFIEERVSKMMEIWGEDTFDSVEHSTEVIALKAPKAPVGEELHGPAEHGGGISQSDIDALFN
jgi:chemotaxis protein CheZ